MRSHRRRRNFVWALAAETETAKSTKISAIAAAVSGTKSDFGRAILAYMAKDYGRPGTRFVAPEAPDGRFNPISVYFRLRSETPERLNAFRTSRI
jgi:hypothetical protein